MILWSIRTFWYKGSAENKKQKHVHKKAHISQKQQPKTQSDIVCFKYEVKRLILVRYDITFNI